jgi:hypothetical protein
MVACQHCGQLFVPVRATARFCGPTCRKASNRANGSPPSAMERFASATGTGTGEVFSVTGTSGTPGAPNASAVTLRRRPNLPAGIVEDETYPGMFRVIRPDGSRSDMANLTRAVEVKRREAA